MPTYEYECESCKHRFTKIQNMKDEPVKTCPECKGPVHRIISGGVGIIFKGSGFYTTDYKNKNRNNSCCGESQPCTNPKRCCKN